MYSVSAAYKRQLNKQEQNTRLIGTINNVPFTSDDIITGSFQITNQCSEVSEVKIGSVYIGQLNMTLKPDITFTDWENLEIIVNEELWIDELNDYESIPLGVFYVDEADDTDEGTAITGYDVIARFIKMCDVDLTAGQPYDLIMMACNKCHVSFGMSRAEVEAFPNGTEAFALYPESDISTWQDYLYWMAQALCCFATSNRIGQLILKRYGKDVVDTIDDDNRFSGSAFSKFTTRYSGVSVVNMETNELEYVGSDPDIYLTYNLGSNPFLQYGSSEGKERIRRNILDGLCVIEYVPFETKVLTGALYDLGDVIRFTNGIASGALSCIMYYNYTFSEYSIAGYGSNPALASAKNKTDKNLEGLKNSIKRNEIQFYVFENAKNINIADGANQEIIDIKFASATAVHVIFQAEILMNVDTTVSGVKYNDALAKVTYIVNESEIEYFHPVETYTDGKHILNLAYVFSVDSNVINRLVVELEMTGGKTSIPAQGIRAVVYGQGLVAAVGWDGLIDLSDNIHLIELDSPEIIPFDEGLNVDVWLDEPYRAAITDQIGIVTPDDALVFSYKGDLSIELEDA